MSEAYKAAGVDLGAGDETSKILYAASKLTWENRSGKFGEITVRPGIRIRSAGVMRPGKILAYAN